MSSNTRLVFSTDPKDKVTCPSCKNFVKECTCVSEEVVNVEKICAVFRLEKAGRNGKTVTVIDQLPRNSAYLEKLSKELKAKCGAGGSFELGPKGGKIEVQGDKREQIKKHLDSLNIKYKGV